MAAAVLTGSFRPAAPSRPRSARQGLLDRPTPFHARRSSQRQTHRVTAAAESAALAAALAVRRPRRKVLLGLGGAAAAPAPAALAEVPALTRKTDVFDGEVMKSPLDTRNYRALTLGNGMRVLLASDPDAVTASSALSVHVGFYSDPEDIPGLAHFCEHMLFLGTKEYPEENSFESFLVANSGSQNAFTSESSTTYFFEVSPSGLRESLQRFASFFREPLFTASATEREVNAISSEFAKNQENDGFRFQQLLKGTASEGHPERHFGCGNRKTLVESRGPEQLRESLKTFFEAYDPAAMSLCIVGKEPLDVLQASTEAYFGSIPQRRLADRPWKSLDPYPPRLSRGTPLIVEAVPVSEARSVSLTWTITFPDRKAREEFLVAKPADYISQILGHEGPSSLQSLLKRKGWANKTIAGVVFDQDDFSIFKVGFDVSEEGLRQKEALYGAVFSVLRQMQERGMDAVPDYSIQETRELAELRWRFAEKPRSQQATLEAVEAMEDRLSPATYLSNRVLLFDPPEDGPNKGSLKRAIFGLLQQLTPERARYATFARENAGKAKQTETWYGVKYAERELQKSAFTGWSTRPTADLLEGWSYPKPNPFIPKDFDLAWPQASAREKAAASSRPPELIRKDDRWRVFFKADQAFGVPKATVILQFWFPDAEHRSSSAPGSAVDTPEGRIVARIWQLSLADRLTEEYYDAQLAGLNAGCGSTTVGLNVSFSGYSDKLPVFVGEVLAKIRDFDGPSESEFARALDNLKREQASFDVQQPFAHAAYFSRLATFCPEYSIEDLRKATSKVTLSAVRDYSRLLRSAEQGFFGQALIHGNLRAKAAQDILSALDLLPFRGASAPTSSTSMLLRSRFACLDAGQECLQVQPEPNAENVNHALVSVFWTGDEAIDGLRTQLLERILKSAFYTSLRTQQQLGYIVQSQSDRIGNLARLVLVVQSSVKAPPDLLAAVDGFLKDFRPQLEALSDSQLQPFKASLREEFLRPDQRLGAETGRWFGEIAGFQYSWRRREEEAELVSGISKQDLLKVFDDKIAAGGLLRRRVTTAVFAASSQRNQAMSEMKEAARAKKILVIEDPLRFNQEAAKWPLRDRDLEMEVSRTITGHS